jgi:hypothetical protein
MLDLARLQDFDRALKALEASKSNGLQGKAHAA